MFARLTSLAEMSEEQRGAVDVPCRGQQMSVVTIEGREQGVPHFAPWAGQAGEAVALCPGFQPCQGCSGNGNKLLALGNTLMLFGDTSLKLYLKSCACTV